jgi:hypothetical protein
MVSPGVTPAELNWLEAMWRTSRPSELIAVGPAQYVAQVAIEALCPRTERTVPQCSIALAGDTPAVRRDSAEVSQLRRRSDAVSCWH